MGEPSSADVLPASAFADILQMTQVALYAFVRHLIASGEDARDIVQNVYVDAWRAAQRGNPPYDRLAEAEIDTGAIRRWLFRVANRQAIDLAPRACDPREMDVYGWVRPSASRHRPNRNPDTLRKPPPRTCTRSARWPNG